MRSAKLKRFKRAEKHAGLKVRLHAVPLYPRLGHELCDAGPLRTPSAQRRKIHRRSKQKTLHLVTALSTQKIQLLRGFHTCGGHFKTAAMGKCDDGRSEGFIIAVGAEILDKAAANLQVAHRQGLKPSEGGVFAPKSSMASRRPNACRRLNTLMSILSSTSTFSVISSSMAVPSRA